MQPNWRACRYDIIPADHFELERTMKLTAQDIHGLYSPTECGLRVWLRARNEPEAEPSEFEQVLFRLGRRHEATHLATLPQVTDLRAFSIEDRLDKTKKLVSVRTPVLYQPVLKGSAMIAGVECEMVGEPDFLIHESNGYVIRDVNLVRRVDEANHPEVILQLQLYGWLYEQVFGQPPLRLEVFNGQSEFVTVPQDVENVLCHLRKVAEIKALSEAPYSPVDWSKCIGCGFHDPCWKRAKAQKDVALVLGVDQGLALELHRQGLWSIQSLASRFDEAMLTEFRRPWGDRMQRVGTAAGTILRSAQALLTNREIALGRPAIPNSDNFLMFDLEGLPPQLEELGKTYLWGMQLFGRNQGEFQPAVAGFGEDGDGQGWNDFLRIAQAIFDQHGDIPFVHWSGYEKTQINEYVRRYGDPTGTAARVLNNLLDLLPNARNSVVLPLYSYSLKEVEKYVGFKRTQAEYGGSWSMARYIEATETEYEDLRSQVMEEILVYNKEDLAATWAVFQWLNKKMSGKA